MIPSPTAIESYVIISPVKNESDFIADTIESVLQQSFLPSEWVIVDDNSEDETPSIVRRYSKEIEWITLIERKDNISERQGGAKVIRAFQHGYDCLSIEDFDFVVKLDGDLVLPTNYFEQIKLEFDSDAALGMVGGICVVEKGGLLIPESSHSYHVRGAFKSVRQQCWHQIGGFRETYNWDSLDELSAMFFGWKTKVVDLRVHHRRITSGAYKKRIRIAVRDGVSAYKEGNGFRLLVFRTLVRLTFKPYMLYSVLYFTGYVKEWLSQSTKEVDPDLASFINEFHLNRIKNSILHGLRKFS